MMREIKFRAYCDKRKEFVRIIDLGLFGTGEIKEVAFTYKDEPYERVSCELPGDVKLIKYTGLLDKKGKEVYEGDIVRLWSDDGVDYNAQIVFKDGGFCAVDGTIDNFSISRYRLSDFDLELFVIGNIYENPELLGDNQ